jgi:hypothetical protein
MRTLRNRESGKARLALHDADAEEQLRIPDIVITGIGILITDSGSS